MHFVFLTVSPLQDEIFPSDRPFLSSVSWLSQGLRAIRVGEDLCSYTYLVVSKAKGFKKSFSWEGVMTHAGHESSEEQISPNSDNV